MKAAFRSVGAVLAGVGVISALAASTDAALWRLGLLPDPRRQTFSDADALLALSYHLVYAALGCGLAARLAPGRPLAHALAVGGIGVVMSALGLFVIVRDHLAPAWYGWTLMASSLPVAWLGGTWMGKKAA
jgi:hypothetical protein